MEKLFYTDSKMNNDGILSNAEEFCRFFTLVLCKTLRKFCEICGIDFGRWDSYNVFTCERKGYI